MSLGAQRLAGIGLCIVIALAVLLGITKPNPFASHYSYWAMFDTAHGLGAIDRDVRVAGVKVGEVGRVQRVGDNVRVELKLSQQFRLHTDAHAAMRPHTLFEGSNFVDLQPGSPDAPRLPLGGTIPLAQTTNYVTLDRALRVLRPDIRDNLRQLAKVGGETLRDGAITGVQTTLKNLPDMSAALAPAARAAQGPHRRELVGAVRGLARTVDALASEREELIPLAQRLSRTNQALAVDGGAPLDAGLRELPGTLEALDANAPALDAVVERLTTFASRVGTSGPRALARALRGATPLLIKARPALRDGTPIVRDARLIAKRLAAAKGGLVTMFRVLRSPLSTFPDTFAALNAKTSLGAPSGALQLVGGAFEAGDAAVRSYQTVAQNPNAPGHSLRVQGYLDPAAVGDLTSALGLPVLQSRFACATVARVSRRAVPAVRASGGCR